MSPTSLAPTRRSFLTISVATFGMLLRFFVVLFTAMVSLVPPAIVFAQQPATQPNTTDEDKTIRPFQIKIPEEALVELRQRIAATRWPEKETVADSSQGVQLAMVQKLARYWGTDYDWRKCEAKLNALPQFITEIDGLDIHFIHVRSKHAKRCR